MKAAVLHEFNGALTIEDVAIDEPHAGEVRVRIAAAAICHSDLHLMQGDWPAPLPLVPGHEAAGIVDEVAAGVTSVKRGDRVVISLLRSCGTCANCSAGATHICETVFPLDRETRLRGADGDVQQGIKVGAFAEYAIVDQSQVVSIPDSLPLDRAALLGCGVITGAGAVFNTARVAAGESVVVIGAGGVGLNVIQAAALSGAAPIVAIDRVETKLEAAIGFGASDVMNAATFEPRDLPKGVRKLTKGRGADHVFVTVGVAEVVSQALTMARRGGTVVVVGMPGVRDTAAVRVFDLVWNEQRVVGSRMGSTRLQEDVPRLAQMHLQGRLKLEELITARYPLERINDAMAQMRDGAALRNVIVMDGSREGM